MRAEQENRNFPVPVREFALVRQVRPSRPASAPSFSTRRLNLCLLAGSLPLAFREGVYFVNSHRAG